MPSPLPATAPAIDSVLDPVLVAARPHRARAVAGPLDLPPAGVSPALDLQRRVGEAALRGFYDAPVARRSGLERRRLTVAATSAALCWSLVFGIGALLLA